MNNSISRQIRKEKSLMQRGGVLFENPYNKIPSDLLNTGIATAGAYYSGAQIGQGLGFTPEYQRKLGQMSAFNSGLLGLGNMFNNITRQNESNLRLQQSRIDDYTNTPVNLYDNYNYASNSPYSDSGYAQKGGVVMPNTIVGVGTNFNPRYKARNQTNSSSSKSYNGNSSMRGYYPSYSSAIKYKTPSYTNKTRSSSSSNNNPVFTNTHGGRLESQMAYGTSYYKKGGIPKGTNGQVKNSWRKGKKKAVFMDGSWHHFGDSSMQDYRQHKSEKRKKAYHSRHAKNMKGNSPRAKAFRKYNRITWQTGGSISELGYNDNSPYINSSYLDINTPNGTIDMSNTGMYLQATDNTGYSKILKPYSGTHQFKGNKVREVPLKKVSYQRGGDTNGDLYEAQKYLAESYDKGEIISDRGFSDYEQAFPESDYFDYKDSWLYRTGRKADELFSSYGKVGEVIGGLTGVNSWDDLVESAARSQYEREMLGDSGVNLDVALNTADSVPLVGGITKLGRKLVNRTLKSDLAKQFTKEKLKEHAKEIGGDIILEMLYKNGGYTSRSSSYNKNKINKMCSRLSNY